MAALRAISVEEILAWADRHFELHGRWPVKSDGRIDGARGETWLHVDGALSAGRRGLSGGSSLAGVLGEHRGVRREKRVAPLSESQIVVWADAYHLRTGEWPTPQSGAIPQSGGETWQRVQSALREGRWGLPGGSSIAKLLHDRRDVRNKADLPRLTLRVILKWADDHFAFHGEWPTRDSGVVEGGEGTTWMAVQDALYLGGRGLPGGYSLAQLLYDKRDVRNIQNLPDLEIGQILVWADAFRDRSGNWPIRESGVIPGTDGENWSSVDHALRVGSRGLPGGQTLAQMLAEKRGKRNLRDLEPLTFEKIRNWAGLHFERTSRWPSQTAGDVLDAPGEKWRNIDTALYKGLRGLSGGSSLAKLLRDVKSESRSGVPREGADRSAVPSIEGGSSS
jgi:hypothetical protein